MGSREDDLIEELRQQRAAFEAEIERLRGVNGRLREVTERQACRIAELEELLSGAQRAGKRQAAPFSKGAPKETPKRPGRRRGDLGRHCHRRPPEQIDETLVAPLPERCPECGGLLEEPRWVEQFQEELPVVRPRVTRFEIPVAHCRDCGKRVQCRHPQQTSDALAAAGAQLGPRAVAVAASLHKELGLSLQKTARVLEDIAGITISRGGLCQALARLGERCQPTYEALRQQAHQASLMTMDETGWRVNGRHAWLWVAVSEAATVYAIRRGRGFEDAAWLVGEHFGGVLVRDGWGPYRCFVEAVHQTCVAHLLRRCGEMLEVARGRAREVPRAVQGVLLVALWLREAHQQGEISELDFEAVRQALEARVEGLLARPAITRPENRRLLGHVGRERENLFTFLDRSEVPATNWQAEQGIRPAVVNRKTWGGNRTWNGARTQERLMTVLRTCRQRARDPLGELVELLRQPEPVLMAGLALSEVADRGG